MTISKMLRAAFVGLVGVWVLTTGCGWAYNDSDVLVLTQVNVPAGNGSASVNFHALAGQQVVISLTGRLTSMVPIGNLVGPNGSQTTTPAASSSSSGFNTATVSLPDTGVYRLEVSDNTGTGGAVTVRVELAAGA